MKKVYAHLIVFLFLFCLKTSAQKIFSEGVLKYDVFINESTTAEGVYIVTVKNGFTKRELAMNSGYNNIVIYNHATGKTISLNVDHDTKYALEMSAAEVQEKNKRFEHASFTALDQHKKLAGYACQASNVVYQNGESASFFYTAELVPQNDFFNAMFPGLKGVPLEYEVKSSGTTIMKFKASIIETKGIDSKIFEIPKDYKIVTKAELEQLK